MATLGELNKNSNIPQNLVDLEDFPSIEGQAEKYLRVNAAGDGFELVTIEGGGSGEANTASNVGAAGVGVFARKTLADLEFKNINAASSKISITDNTDNDEIDIDVSEGNIIHDNLSGAGSNTHADIDTHIATDDIHRSINDSGTLSTELWSASKISTELAGKANSSHTHTSSSITDFDEASQDAINNMLTPSDSLEFDYDDTANVLQANVVVDDVTIGVETGVGITLKLGGVSAVNLNATGSPTDGQMLSYDQSTSKFEWVGANAHTHSASDITDFSEALQDNIGSALTDSTSINFSYDDVGNSMTAVVIPNSGGGLEVVSGGVQIANRAITPGRIDVNNAGGVPTGGVLRVASGGTGYWFEWSYPLYDVIADQSPELGANLAANNNSISGLRAVTFNSEPSNGGTTINWANAQKQRKVLSASSTTLTFTNALVGHYQLKLVQDATGGRNVTWPSNVKWVNATVPTLSAAPNAIDIITLYYDGTDFYGSASLNFA